MSCELLGQMLTEESHYLNSEIFRGNLSQLDDTLESVKNKKLESRLEDQEESTDPSRRYEKKNNRYIYSTDPDAALVNRGKPKLSYQVHLTVEEQNEIITVTDVTPGDVNETHLMIPLLEQHKMMTGVTSDTVVADSKYGTFDNFVACDDRGMQAAYT